jgi:Ser/Thr protein kinase RdoA (MazF antagonist)
MREAEQRIANAFDFPAEVVRVSPFGAGIINDTFLVLTKAKQDGKYILQRINDQVFPRPELIMENLGKVIREVNKEQKDLPSSELNHFSLPNIIPTRNGNDYHLDEEKKIWRAMSFIDNSTALEQLQNFDQAKEVGRALGKFHYLLSSLDPNSLHDTLPGFHITPQYVDHYDKVVGENRQIKNTPETRFCSQFIASHKDMSSVLENAKSNQLLSIGIIHGDPKLNNILFHNVNWRAVSIIDLDTVKPGLRHYDMGDCLRSCCNTEGENPDKDQHPRFDTDICRAILQGYIQQAKAFLTKEDYNYLFPAIRLIPFELGLRFYTDYLEGNKYFKVTDPEQNLYRAIVQFQLVTNIEKQERQIQLIVNELY